MTVRIDVSHVIVAWAHQAVKDQPLFDYLEVRPFPLYWPTPVRRIKDDCGATNDLYYFMAGAEDPMENGFDGEGNTESLWAAAQARNQIFTDPLQTRAGYDMVLYYEGSPSAASSVHTALIVQGGIPDPVTVSHGQESEPAFVTVSQDGRPHVFARFPTIATDYRKIQVPPGWTQAIPGSPLSRVPASFRPAPIKPPTIKRGDLEPRAWIQFGRWGLQAAHCGPVLGRFVPSPRPGGDGLFTCQATERFQEREHLPVTGELDDATWARLGAVA